MDKEGAEFHASVYTDVKMGCCNSKSATIESEDNNDGAPTPKEPKSKMKSTPEKDNIADAMSLTKRENFGVDERSVTVDCDGQGNEEKVVESALIDIDRNGLEAKKQRAAPIDCDGRETESEIPLPIDRDEQESKGNVGKQPALVDRDRQETADRRPEPVDRDGQETEENANTINCDGQEAEENVNERPASIDHDGLKTERPEPVHQEIKENRRPEHAGHDGQVIKENISESPVPIHCDAHKTKEDVKKRPATIDRDGHVQETENEKPKNDGMKFGVKSDHVAAAAAAAVKKKTNAMKTEVHEGNTNKTAAEFSHSGNRTNLDSRTVLIVGKTGVGKATIANKILGGECFQVSASVESVTKSADIRVYPPGLVKSDREYNYAFKLIDTVGVSYKLNQDQINAAIESFIQSRPHGIHLILFVFKNGRFTREDQAAFNFFITCKFAKEISLISALVITCCEGLDDTARQQIKCDLMSDPSTSKIAEFMQKKIYTVGFPNTDVVKPELRMIYEESIKADKSTLKNLLANCKQPHLSLETFQHHMNKSCTIS